MKWKLRDNHLKTIYFTVFFLSGFSGLIYESIWAHYLKLFLGHSAYAQALVLVIFMGGMSFGAWVTAGHGKKIRNLLVLYAVVEGTVGICSLVFHYVFIATTDFVFLSVLPSFDWGRASDLMRWTLAALLVLPQSILLGTTFPLMSGGIIRSFPEHPGRTLSILYFTNSLGAAIGVLASGFVLIGSVGLPGTLFIAGMINLSLALVVWMLSHNDSRQAFPAEVKPVLFTDGPGPGGLLKVLLLCSAITGTASFMYEIGWIRMLSLVLGASTHAFELMLSAFILGLAIGGYWIRKRVERFHNPVLALGWIQLIMGFMAVATLPVYGQSFELMAYFFKAISKTDQGYVLFNLASHSIALIVMLPATICAGMTLPLITFVLFTGGHGEPAIGKVYSVNTLGGLVGIAAGVFFIMPAMGLKSLITGGAILDIVLGLFLMWYALSAVNRNLWRGMAAVSGGVILVVIVFFQISPDEISSTVFRTGEISENDEILYYKDGKTATIITALSDRSVTISTNGKPDAAISKTPIPGSDELTMVLLGAIPMAVHPEAKNIANIGMGSGLTSHVLLANPGIQRLDTIEIEEAMINGAKVFGKRVERTFTDPRSNINIDDAKAFFSSQQRTYDIIISEPSNPWVSGVAGLFTKEFYKHIKRHLADDGLFVQWLHLYEMNMELVSSVIKAVSAEFDDYAIYILETADIAILARETGKVPALSENIFSMPDMKYDLKRIGVRNRSDLSVRYMGNKKTLDGLFASYPLPANSDYFPVLDQGAVKAFFMNKDAYKLLDIKTFPLPILEVLEPDNADRGRPAGVSKDFFISLHYRKAAAVAQYYKQRKSVQPSFDQRGFDSESVQMLKLLSTIEHQCSERGTTLGWLPGLHWLAKSVLPYMQAKDLRPFWDYLESTTCYADLNPYVYHWIQLYRAVDERNYTEMITVSETLLSSGGITSEDNFRFVTAAALLGSLALGERDHGLSVMNTYIDETPDNIPMRLLAVHFMER